MVKQLVNVLGFELRVQGVVLSWELRQLPTLMQESQFHDDRGFSLILFTKFFNSGLGTWLLHSQGLVGAVLRHFLQPQDEWLPKATEGYIHHI